MNLSLLNNSNIVSESILIYRGIPNPWFSCQPTNNDEVCRYISSFQLSILLSSSHPQFFSFINIIIPISIVDHCCLVLSIYLSRVPFHILHSRFKMSLNFYLTFERMLKISIYNQFTYTTCTAPSRHILLIAHINFIFI